MKTLCRLILGGVVVGLLASCSSTPQVSGRGAKQAYTPVSCVAVLPARAGEDEDVARSGGKMDNVLRGAAYADSLLRSELAGDPAMRMADSAISGNLNSLVRQVSEETGCEGVLVMTVYKFRQREGSTIATDAPASTSFDIRIYDGNTRHVLWAADFSETQQSLLSDIFSFGKAQSRGFKWITVEELMAQGLKERLEYCPYLKHE